MEVNVLFQEGLRLGDKSQLSENIEKALTRMKCPHLLSSQQLIFLDCIKIQPVVRWLMARLIEVREETAVALRLFSSSQFSKEYQHLPSERSAHETGIAFLEESTHKYMASRRYRSQRTGGQRAGLFGPRLSSQPLKVDRKTADEAIHSTLVEYGAGHLYTMALMGSGISAVKARQQAAAASDAMEQKRRAVAAKLAEEDETSKKEQAKQALKRQEQLLAQMQQIEGDLTKISGQVLGSVMERGSDLIRQQGEQYNAMREELSEFTAEHAQKFQGQFQHKRAMAQFARIKEQQEDKLAAIQPKHDELQAELEEMAASYQERVATNAELESAIEEMLAMETDENREDLASLRALVALNENLKDQITKFKESCRAEREHWAARIAKAKAAEQAGVIGDDPDDPEALKFDTIDETWQAAQRKIQDVQSLLSTKARAIALVKRKMDEIPSRRELQQYQRQFLELYEQMAQRFTETRQYYHTYNTLCDRRNYLSREVTILESIQENYANALKAKGGKQKLADSLAEIEAAVQKNLATARDKLAEEQARSVALDETHSKSIEKERQYYKAAKDFQDECSRTEDLQEELEQVRQEALRLQRELQGPQDE